MPALDSWIAPLTRHFHRLREGIGFRLGIRDDLKRARATKIHDIKLCQECWPIRDAASGNPMAVVLPIRVVQVQAEEPVAGILRLLHRVVTADRGMRRVETKTDMRRHFFDKLVKFSHVVQRPLRAVMRQVLPGNA